MTDEVLARVAAGIPETDDVARHGNASRRIADALRASILSGELPPGARIRQEDVAARYGASRIPVRGALRILESDGLVRLVANAGAWVAEFDLAECEEVYRIRERVEPLLLRASRPGLTPEVFDRMNHLARQMEKAATPEHFVHLDREFHELSYSGADTVVLGEIVQRLWNMTQQYRLAYTRLFQAEGSTIVHDEHRMLVRALREGDDEQAGVVARSHIRRTRRALAGHPELFSTGGG